jgi:hypothetical protein
MDQIEVAASIPQLSNRRRQHGYQTKAGASVTQAPRCPCPKYPSSWPRSMEGSGGGRERCEAAPARERDSTAHARQTRYEQRQPSPMTRPSTPRVRSVEQQTRLADPPTHQTEPPTHQTQPRVHQTGCQVEPPQARLPVQQTEEAAHSRQS